jgi:hypothetical protein
VFVVSTLLLAAIVAVSVVALGGFLPRDGVPGTTTEPGVAASLGPDAATPRTTGPSVPSPTLPARATPTVLVEPSESASPEPTGSVPGATATPFPTLPPRTTATPGLPTDAAPSPEVSPPGPGTPRPTRRPLSTATPGPVTSVASPRAPPPADFTCSGTTTFRDPLDRSWRLNGVYWGERNGFDRLTLRLVPAEDTGRPARTTVELRPAETVESELGLPAPGEGDMAVLVRFSDAVSLTRDLQGDPSLPAVRTFAATNGDDGRVWAVFGVLSEGCYALQVPFWTDPSLQTTPFVDVTLDVEH